AAKGTGEDPKLPVSGWTESESAGCAHRQISIGTTRRLGDGIVGPIHRRGLPSGVYVVAAFLVASHGPNVAQGRNCLFVDLILHSQVVVTDPRAVQVGSVFRNVEAEGLKLREIG